MKIQISEWICLYSLFGICEQNLFFSQYFQGILIENGFELCILGSEEQTCLFSSPLYGFSIDIEFTSVGIRNIVRTYVWIVAQSLSFNPFLIL